MDLPSIARPSAQLAQRIDALLCRVETAGFLAPDASLVLGRADALAEIDALAEALADAVSSAGLRGVPTPTRPVSIERSLEVAARRWLEAWRDASDTIALDELWALVTEDRAAFAEVLPRQRRLALQSRLEDASDAMRLRSHALAHRWIDGLSPYIVLAARQLEWLAAGRAEPSPFVAALELFERGAWPMLMPDGAILVWAPDVALRDAPPDEWLATRAAIDELSRAEPRVPLSRCAMLGLGARVISNERVATTLVVSSTDGRESRVELGPLAVLSAKRGSDARVTSTSSAQWSVFALGPESVLFEYSAGFGARRASTSSLCNAGETARLGALELRAEPNGRGARGAAEGLLNTVECGTIRPFADRATTDTTRSNALQWAARAAARAFDSSPKGRAARSLIDQWTEGANFEPTAATLTDRAALEWAEERVRALFMAVHRRADCVASAPSSVVIERSIVRAAARVDSAWRAATRERLTIRQARFSFALDQLMREQRESSELDASRRGAVLLLARVLQRSATAWSRDVLPFASRFAGIDASAIATLAQRAALDGSTDEADNPWAAMLTLWRQGALFWLLPDDAALLFVPTKDAARGLLINPDDEPPPVPASPNFVASTLFAAAEPHALAPLSWPALVRRNPRGAQSRIGGRPAPDAQLTTRRSWLWAATNRLTLGEAAIDEEGRLLTDSSEGPRVAARLVAVDGEHWVIAERRWREQLIVNGRSVRARPVAHGDSLALVRDGETLFEGRYQCGAQQMR